MAELSAKEKIDWIRLARSENIGAVTFKTLLNYYGTAAAALEAVPGMAKAGGKKKNIVLFSKSQAEEEYEHTVKMGGQVLGSCEPDYPQLLRQIHDYPPVISVLGHVALLNRPSVAIVGTREATLNGKKFAKKLGYDLADAGYVVVSGMAIGIDRAAHEGALMKDSGGTVAVLGSGVDVVYPSSNKDIYAEIKGRGVVLSDYPLGMPPNGPHFPRRNRIISGMSQGIVVVEAERKSGTLVTARLALEHNRELFAVPGSPLDKYGQGPNYLIKQGAHLVESASDILDVLNNMPRPDLREASLLSEENGMVRPSEQDMAEAREVVLRNLSASRVGVDEIIRETGFAYPVVAMVLLELELAGRLERHPGGNVSLVME